MASSTASPTTATIFAYQVGFGDCLLVRFEYANSTARHILIDFGTTGLPDDVASEQMTVIAKDIEEKCGGKLDAVVATHRHADHISGFATKTNGQGSGDIIRSLAPKVVVQPWTETPDLAIDAEAPATDHRKRLSAYALGRVRMNDMAKLVVKQLDAKGSGFAKSLAGSIRFIGEDNIANESAVKNLATMSKKNVYTYHGGPSGLDAVLPGVKTRVLGPPTLKQTDTIRKQRSRDADEFWQLQLTNLKADAEATVQNGDLFPGHPTVSGGKLPRDARWLADRMKDARGDQVLQIVRALDKQMNNTSLILLFEAGKKKLLFPGDAQIENWQYALSKDDIAELLASVDVYKVGHHGSLNATPKSLWAAFKKRGNQSKTGRLKTVLSTMPGKHGTEAAKTEVPRRTLLSALQSESELHSTHTLDRTKLYEEIRIDLR